MTTTTAKRTNIPSVRHQPPARLLLAVLGLSSLGGCPPGSMPPPGMQADLAVDKPDLAVALHTYSTEKLGGCGQSGFQSQIAVAPGGAIGIVSIANTKAKGTCTLLMRPPMDVPTYDLCFAEAAAPGAAFKIGKVASAEYLALTGVALAYDAMGTALVAYTGNGPGVKQADQRCGATNLLLRSGTGGVFGAPKVVATGSQSGGLVPDQKANCIQDVCNSGDATGYWPAIARSGAGQVLLAWRDIHFGFATDDFASSDVEYAEGPGFAALTVDVARGGGSYTRLALDQAGKAAIVHYNGEREKSTNGIWINHQISGAWKATRVTGARIGELLGFAIGPSGLHALAWYDADGARLVYMESMDGESWSTPLDVDTDGITGQFPSLAFDGNGEPAIAYYRCRDYDPMDRSCDRDHDGLMLARRAGGSAGRWSIESVTAKGGLFDGIYPALAFAGGRAVIAYQTRGYDPGSGTSSFELDVAREDP